jgi:branched-subunit amino acid transport protein
MIELIAVVIVGAGTYFSRAVFILALADRKLPDPVLVSLRFVAPAVLSALVVALLIDADGNVAIGLPELSAFVGGGAVAYKTKNHILTLIVGMGVFWLVRALVQ